jgi:hypothetical protein
MKFSTIVTAALYGASISNGQTLGKLDEFGAAGTMSMSADHVSALASDELPITEFTGFRGVTHVSAGYGLRGISNEDSDRSIPFNETVSISLSGIGASVVVAAYLYYHGETYNDDSYFNT